MVSIQVETRIYCVFTYESVNYACSKPFAERRICMGVNATVHVSEQLQLMKKECITTGARLKVALTGKYAFFERAIVII